MLHEGEVLLQQLLQARRQELLQGQMHVRRLQGMLRVLHYLLQIVRRRK
jgi:hypothetical protein